MAPFSEQIPMEELFDRYASASAIEEATANRTIQSGEYNLRFTKLSAQRRAKDDERDPEREEARCVIAVTDDEGKKRGNMFATASWQEKRTAKGFLDGKFKLWGQLVKATYPDKKTADIATVNVVQAMNDIPEVSMRGYVSESFLVPDGTGNKVWLSPDTEEQATDFRSRGCKPQNFVRNVRKAT